MPRAQTALKPPAKVYTAFQQLPKVYAALQPLPKEGAHYPPIIGQRLYSPPTIGEDLYSLSTIGSRVSVPRNVDGSADAEREIDRGSDEGETEVKSDAAVNLPALLDLFHPKDQQRHDDQQHADADRELQEKLGYLYPILPRLMRSSRQTAIVKSSRQQ